MDKVEIDPKLFVTCRLCVEDTGIYQIIPAVQAQIKYCFDIDVHSFDRLPQLICKKCEAILSDFYTKKKAFIEKQVKLKAYLCDKTKAIIAPQQDAVSSSQVDSEISSRVKDKENDGSLSDVSSSEDFESIPSGTGTTSSSIKIKTFAWKDKYRKVYKCRLCGKPFHHENFVKQHIKAEHDTLVKKYRKYVTKSCRVMLNKIDGKANITEENRILVLSQDQLLTHSRSALYHINYHLKKDEVLSDINSSDEEIIVTQKTYKRRRLLSRSSTETVVIERKKDSKTPLVSHDKEPISECINIDDSSDEESMSYVENIVGKSTDNAQITANNTETNDLGANEQNVINTKDIENIVNVCIGKYNKKNLTYVQDNTTLNQLSGDVLKHKLLSMGCKVLNKKVINCTGLLRYMEHNYDLDLIWKPVNSIACNYIKVRSNVSAPEKSDKNDWIDVEDIYISQEPSQEPKNELSRSEGHLQKLLNTHPVANPKKMPKKCDKEETMDQIVSDYFANELETISDSICMPIITSTTSLANGQTDSNPTDDTALPAANGAMPTDNSALPTDTSALPTDTSALPTDTCALPTDNCALYTDTSALPMDTSALPIDTSALPAKNNAQPGPLIKVKPVSELMADTPNNIWKLHSQANNMVTNKNQLVYVTPLSSSANSNIHAAPAPLASHHYLVPITSNESTPVEPPETPAPETTPPRDTVVLDTVHFPNTRTDSPFSYFKSLLLLYSINLIDSTSPLSRDYVSLIKFKLQFTQETNKPIVLSLALGLSCCGNNYCIKVRGRNQEAIDVSKMSANWQWEVLKSYKGNIVEKLLQNAQKYGQDTLTMTKKFICLLKSIHYITTKKGVTS